MAGLSKQSSGTLRAQYAETYSRVYHACGVAPLFCIAVDGLSAYRGTESKAPDLKISVRAQIGDTDCIQAQDFVYSAFEPGYGRVCHAASSQSSDVFSFECKDFELVDAVFDQVQAETQGKLTVSLCYGDYHCTEQFCVTYLADGQWEGEKETPGFAAAFVEPCSEQAGRIAGRAAEWLAQSSVGETDAFAAAGALYAALQEQAVVSLRPDGAQGRDGAMLRSPDELLGAKSRAATPMELAILFCSCAECMGLAPIVAVLAKGQAEQVLCGVRCWDLNGEPGYCGGQSAAPLTVADLLAAQQNQEIVLFESSCFSAAHHTAFSAGCQNALRQLEQTELALVLYCDIYLARAQGIRSIQQDRAAAPQVCAAPQVAAQTLDKADQDHALGFSEPDWGDIGGTIREVYRVCPALSDFRKSRGPVLFPLVPDPEAFGACFGEQYPLLPLPDEISWTGLEPFCRDFCSVAIDAAAPTHATLEHATEKGAQAAVAAWWKERAATSIVCAENSQAFLQKAESLAVARDASRLYVVCGLFREKGSGGAAARYAPAAFVPAELVKTDDGYALSLSGAEPVVNRALVLELLSRAGIRAPSFFDTPMPCTLSEIFALFSELADNLNSQRTEAGMETAFAAVKEFVICRLALGRAEQLLDKAQRQRQVREHPLFRRLSGWETAPEETVRSENADRMRGFVPPYLFSRTQANALSCRDSFVLCGKIGTGKKQVVAALCAKAAAQGESVLVVSDGPAFLSSFHARLAEQGLDALCLDLTETVSFPMLYGEVASRMESLADGQDCRETAAEEDAGFLHGIHQILFDYEYACNHESPFGISLHAAIAGCDRAWAGRREPAAVVDRHAFDEGAGISFEGLCTLTEQLCDRALAAMAGTGCAPDAPLSNHPLAAFTGRSDPMADDSNTEQDFKQHLEGSLNLCGQLVSLWKEMELSGAEDIQPQTLKDLSALSALCTVLAGQDGDPAFPAIELFSMPDGPWEEEAIRLQARDGRIRAIREELPFFEEELWQDAPRILKGERFFQKLFGKKEYDQYLSYVREGAEKTYSRMPVRDIEALLEEYVCLLQTGQKADSPLSALLGRALEPMETLKGRDSCAALIGLIQEMRAVAGGAPDRYLKKMRSFAQCAALLVPSLLDMGFDNNVRYLAGAGILDREHGLYEALHRAQQAAGTAQCYFEYRWFAKKAKDAGLYSFVERVEQQGAGQFVRDGLIGSLYDAAAREIIARDKESFRQSAFYPHERYFTAMKACADRAACSVRSAWRVRARETLISDRSKAARLRMERFASGQDKSRKDMFMQCGTLVQTLFPIVLADSSTVSQLFGKETGFDLVIYDGADRVVPEYAFPVLSRGKRSILLCETANRSGTLAQKAAKQLAVVRLDESFLGGSGLHALYASSQYFNGMPWFPDAHLLAQAVQKNQHPQESQTSWAGAKVLWMDGAQFDPARRINQDEAKACVETAIALCNNMPAAETILVTSALVEQAAWICGLMDRCSDDTTKQAFRCGRLRVEPLSKLGCGRFDHVVLSLAYALADGDGNPLGLPQGAGLGAAWEEGSELSLGVASALFSACKTFTLALSLPHNGYWRERTIPGMRPLFDWIDFVNRGVIPIRKGWYDTQDAACGKHMLAAILADPGLWAERDEQSLVLLGKQSMMLRFADAVFVPGGNEKDRLSNGVTVTRPIVFLLERPGMGSVYRQLALERAWQRAGCLSVAVGAVQLFLQGREAVLSAVAQADRAQRERMETAGA